MYSVHIQLTLEINLTCRGWERRLCLQNSEQNHLKGMTSINLKRTWRKKEISFFSPVCTPVFLERWWQFSVKGMGNPVEILYFEGAAKSGLCLKINITLRKLLFLWKEGRWARIKLLIHHFLSQVYLLSRIWRWETRHVIMLYPQTGSLLLEA